MLVGEGNYGTCMPQIQKSQEIKWVNLDSYNDISRRNVAYKGSKMKSTSGDAKP